MISLLQAALAVALVSPGTSAQETPELTADSEGLSINLPINRDLNVMRRQTISVGDLAESVSTLQSTVNTMQLNGAQYLGAQQIISNVLSQTTQFARQQGAIEATISAMANRLEAAESRAAASESRAASAIAAAQAAMNTTLERFMQESIVQQSSTIAEAANVAQGVARTTESFADCSLQGKAYNYSTGQCAVSTAVVVGSAAGNNAPSSCNAEGSLTYDHSTNSLKVCNGDIYVPVMAPNDILSRVYQRTFSTSKSQDSGYINDRILDFTKHSDSTYIQVDYYDNFRVHGGTYCYANWNVMICNPDGNNCQECSRPGKLNLHRYSHQQHNYWMNDHYSGMMTGLCNRRGSTDLRAGRYRLRVMINNNRCDIHTGHGGQVGSLSVKEVLKV